MSMKRSPPEQQRILDNSFAKETLSGQFCDQRECCLMAAKGSIKEKAQRVFSNQKRHGVRGKGKNSKDRLWALQPGDIVNELATKMLAERLLDVQGNVV